jgi:hypothetical protein
VFYWQVNLKVIAFPLDVLIFMVSDDDNNNQMGWMTDRIDFNG